MRPAITILISFLLSAPLFIEHLLAAGIVLVVLIVADRWASKRGRKWDEQFSKPLDEFTEGDIYK